MPHSLIRFLAVAVVALAALPSLATAQTAGAGDVPADNPGPGGPEYDYAVLQALDKVTARVTKLSVPVGGTVRFGSLDIGVRTCRKRPPEETPESAAFLDIFDSRPDEETVSLFRGWMFASSPALNALEHPVYDVWVLDCRSTDSTSPSATGSGSSE